MGGLVLDLRHGKLCMGQVTVQALLLFPEPLDGQRFEQALLILTGGGLGTVLGVLASLLFIPYLQVGVGKTAQVPPFVVQIAWSELWTIYAVFGMMFVVAVGALIVLLVRMKVFYFMAIFAVIVADALFSIFFAQVGI